MHDEGEDPTNLEQLLDQLERAAGGEVQPETQVSLALLVEAVGERAFGPLLVIAGLITVMPLIGDIPGVPTLMALLVALSAGQLLLQRKRLWLPDWMLRRSLSQRHFLRDFRADVALTAVDHTYGADHFTQVGALGDVRGSTCLHYPCRVWVVGTRRDSDNLYLIVIANNTTDRFQPADAGHTQVHQDHVRALFTDLGYGFLA